MLVYQGGTTPRKWRRREGGAGRGVAGHVRYALAPAASVQIIPPYCMHCAVLTVARGGRLPAQSWLCAFGTAVEIRSLYSEINCDSDCNNFHLSLDCHKFCRSQRRRAGDWSRFGTASPPHIVYRTAVIPLLQSYDAFHGAAKRAARAGWCCVATRAPAAWFPQALKGPLLPSLCTSLRMYVVPTAGGEPLRHCS